jgi:sugar O-acyltransferase (sialic acid O-acetyltransferase NeuD family)
MNHFFAHLSANQFSGMIKLIIVIGLDLDLVFLLNSEYPLEDIGYVDKENKNIKIISYLGTDDKLLELSKCKSNKFIFGMEHAKRKQEIIFKHNLNMINLISKKTVINYTDIDRVGLIIQDFTFLSSVSSLGNFVKVNTGSQIHHNVEISDFVTIAPRVCILGNVKIGKNTYIGAGAIVLPNLEIGENCIVGAGSVVTRNIPNSGKVKGNPARLFE